MGQAHLMWGVTENNEYVQLVNMKVEHLNNIRIAFYRIAFIHYLNSNSRMICQIKARTWQFLFVKVTCMHTEHGKRQEASK